MNHTMCSGWYFSQCSGGQVLTSYRGGLDVISDHPLWDLCWIKWRWDGLFSEYFCFLVIFIPPASYLHSYMYRYCCIIIAVYGAIK